MMLMDFHKLNKLRIKLKWSEICDNLQLRVIDKAINNNYMDSYLRSSADWRRDFNIIALISQDVSDLKWYDIIPFEVFSKTYRVSGPDGWWYTYTLYRGNVYDVKCTRIHSISNENYMNYILRYTGLDRN